MNYSKYSWYVPLEKMKTIDNTPKYLIIHHTAGKRDTFESVQRYHIYGRYIEGKEPFENIGYHKFIEKDGTVRDGRPEYYHGAHAPTHNRMSIGIALSGDFDKELPTEAQAEALKSLMSDLCKKYSIPVENIVPHRTVTKTSCYGKNLPDDWARNLLIQTNRDQLEPAPPVEELEKCREEKSKLQALLDKIRNLL